MFSSYIERFAEKFSFRILYFAHFRQSWRSPLSHQIAAVGSDPIPPIGEQIGHGLVKRDFRRPAGVSTELAGIGHLKVGVDRTQTIGVGLDGDVLHGRHREQRAEHFADRACEGAADVVIGARLRVVREQEVVCLHGIAHIGPGAHAVQVAHLENRWNPVAFDQRDLLGKARFGEDVAAAGPGVREHPRRHHGHAVGFGIEAPDQVGADLGDRIGRRRVERAFLVDGKLLLRHASEDLRRSADMDDRVEALLADRLEQAAGALDVGVERASSGLSKLVRGKLCAARWKT